MPESAGTNERYREFMTTRPATPYRDPDLESWIRWAGALYFTLVLGSQFMAEQPGVPLLLISLAFWALPAAVGGGILMAISGFVKIIFE
jgi:hypothetical protein